MIKKENLQIIEVDYWFGDEVTVVGGSEVMLVKEIAISEDRISYGCFKNDGTTVWYTKSLLKGFIENKQIGFVKAEK